MDRVTGLMAFPVVSGESLRIGVVVFVAKAAQVYLGEATPVTTPTTPPVFTGSGTFQLLTASPRDAKLNGSNIGGRYTGGPANVTIQIALVEGQPPIELHLIGTKIQADVTATTCANGILGGAVTETELNATIIPKIAELMNAAVVGCPNTDDTICSPADRSVLTLFDKNQLNAPCPSDPSLVCPCGGTASSPEWTHGGCGPDVNITVDEIMANDLIASLLAPDVDLLDGSGNYNPNSDDTKESLSLGLGFTCVGATYTSDVE